MRKIKRFLSLAILATLVISPLLSSARNSYADQWIWGTRNIDGGVVTSGSFPAEPHMTCRGRTAVNARNVTIEAGGKLKFFAENAGVITLGSGFHAKEGSQFSAIVDTGRFPTGAADNCRLPNSDWSADLTLEQRYGSLPEIIYNGYTTWPTDPAGNLLLFHNSDQLADYAANMSQEGILFVHTGPIESMEAWLANIEEYLGEVEANQQPHFTEQLVYWIGANPTIAAEIIGCTALDTICDVYYAATGQDFHGNKLTLIDRGASGVALFIPFVGGTIISKTDDAALALTRLDNAGDAFTDATGAWRAGDRFYDYVNIKKNKWVQPVADGPQINARHVFYGEINGGAKGFHHRLDGVNPEYARVNNIETAKNAQGVYRARVSVFDETSQVWKEKSTLSTFFPDDWSRARVMDEIHSAYLNVYKQDGLKWYGTSSSGVKIEGWLLDGTNSINSAFPSF